MKLNMPDDRVVKDSTEVSDEKTLTLLISGHDHLFYYTGFFEGQLTETSFTAFRKIIMEKKQQLFRKYKSRDLVILIKVTDKANYKNVVNSLDEMVINGVSTYMLLDPDTLEAKALRDKQFSLQQLSDK